MLSRQDAQPEGLEPTFTTPATGPGFVDRSGYGCINLADGTGFEPVDPISRASCFRGKRNKPDSANHPLFKLTHGWSFRLVSVTGILTVLDILFQFTYGLTWSSPNGLVGSDSTDPLIRNLNHLASAHTVGLTVKHNSFCHNTSKLAETVGFEPTGSLSTTFCFQDRCHKPDSATFP